MLHILWENIGILNPQEIFGREMWIDVYPADFGHMATNTTM